ncbi:BofC C-terminal domain-containing protein [Paenibacillus sp. GD4]|uniref:BofC C-terminal domain-containing protein n=1 Tax=Paenibacillus sp. GD4 TaxID=3068890 RepID=UPI002796B921|nr:BofC C-terminal domain-containing protein [Paenibacillus sp. GD4]MDQ1912421.1 BofC C-terminal domain-containing protein [Paenibacillus sp. GD4]
MTVLSFWNQVKRELKKRLRWKRRWIHLAGIVLAIGAASAWWMLQERPDSEQGIDGQQERMVLGRSIQGPAQPEEEVRNMVSGIEGEREVYSKKAYVCGEELQLLGRMNSAQILAYYKEHPSMTVSLADGGKVVFTESVSDLSPQCKHNAYFGLDEQGNLSLFEGVPGSADRNVIRTFFQLNIEYLESSLPRETLKQLYQGIQVSDLDEYNSVLSTFSDYAVEETEKVMQVAPLQ